MPLLGKEMAEILQTRHCSQRYCSKNVLLVKGGGRRGGEWTREDGCSSVKALPAKTAASIRESQASKALAVCLSASLRFTALESSCTSCKNFLDFRTITFLLLFSN